MCSDDLFCIIKCLFTSYLQVFIWFICLLCCKVRVFDILQLCLCCFLVKTQQHSIAALTYTQFVLPVYVYRLLSQAVNDDVCKAIKSLVDAHSKTRKMVYFFIGMMQCIFSGFLSLSTGVA